MCDTTILGAPVGGERRLWFKTICKVYSIDHMHIIGFLYLSLGADYDECTVLVHADNSLDK